MALIQRRGFLDGLFGNDDDKTTATPTPTPTAAKADDPLGLGGIVSGIDSVVSGVNGVVTSVLSGVIPSHSVTSLPPSSSSKSSSASSSSVSSRSSSSSSSSSESSSSQPPSTTDTPSPVITPTPSTILSTSGGHVVTRTVIASAIDVAPSSSPTDTNASNKSFLQNKPLEITVFTFVGIIGLVILISLSTIALRRGRKRRMENDILSSEKENGFPHAPSDADLLSTHSDSQSGLNGVVGGNRLSSVRGAPPRSGTPDSYSIPPSAGYVQTAFNPSAYPAMSPQAFGSTHSLGVSPSAGYGASGNYGNGYDMSQAAFSHPASMMPQPPPSPIPRAPSPLAPLAPIATRQEPSKRMSWDRASGNQSLLMSPTNSLPPYSLTGSPAPQLPMPVAIPTTAPNHPSQPTTTSSTSSPPPSSPSPLLPLPQLPPLPQLTVTSDDDAYDDHSHHPNPPLKVVNE